ncbi:SDR family NAD(P)-dependent oxidoreductase [Streptomyces harbinensis]|uniref:SDR family NAD(P)-dependent oxidoreductase n=1 Tax=Streptomyces harbinensis TaxID=1176198 RepID=UPI003F694E8B
MAHSGGGTVVQVGSALTYRSVPLQSAYCGAKSALRGFIDALRCELRHDRTPVRLTMVQLPAAPGAPSSRSRCRPARAVQVSPCRRAPVMGTDPKPSRPSSSTRTRAVPRTARIRRSSTTRSAAAGAARASVG